MIVNVNDSFINMVDNSDLSPDNMIYVLEYNNKLKDEEKYKDFLIYLSSHDYKLITVNDHKYFVRKHKMDKDTPVEDQITPADLDISSRLLNIMIDHAFDDYGSYNTNIIFYIFTTLIFVMNLILSVIRNQSLIFILTLIILIITAMRLKNVILNKIACKCTSSILLTYSDMLSKFRVDWTIHKLNKASNHE